MLAGLKRIFKLTKTTVVLLVVVCTQGFNLLTFAFVPLANLMLAAAQRLAIHPAVAAASELATSIDREKAAKTRSKDLRLELAAERRRAAQLYLDRKASDARIRKLRTELDDLRKAPRLPNSAVKKIDRLTARIVQRSGVNAARNLASMPLESVPVVGALTIVSVTALEVHDACQTAVEMEELRRLANLPDD